MKDVLLQYINEYPTPEDTNDLIDYTYGDTKEIFQNHSRDLYLAIRFFRKRNWKDTFSLKRCVDNFIGTFPERGPYGRLRPYLLRASAPLRYCCSESNLHLDMARDIHWTLWQMFCHIMGTDETMMSENVDRKSRSILAMVEKKQWMEFKRSYRDMLDLFYCQIYKMKDVQDQQVSSDILSKLLLDIDTGLP